MESWSYVRIFHSGDEYYQNLIEDIQRAQKSIFIESYIFNVDKLTLKILDALEAAKKRGCEIKIVVDGFGSYNSIPQLYEICDRRNLELRVFHPFPYPLAWARPLLAKHSKGSAFILKRMNRRTHRKISIIDEKRVYLGSFNFTQDHCESIVGSNAWRDTGVSVEGDEVKKIVLAFQISYLRTHVKGLISWINRWNLRTPKGDSLLRLNTTQRMRRQLYKDLLRKISASRSRIYITTAYFLPKRSLLRALLKAARRGVDVQILIPGKSDVPMVKWAAFYIVRFLLQKRIPMLEYQKTILHAKTMIIDNETYIGSFNLNHRSLLHDLEIEVILNDQDSIKNMLTQWKKDLNHSRLLSEKDLAAPSWLARLIYYIAFRLRYML